MTAKMIGYRRVSTAEQNADRQLEELIAAGLVDPVFTDKASGKDVDRPKLAEAIRYVRPGETLVVHSMDRLARNAGDLRAVVNVLTKGGEIAIGGEVVKHPGGAKVQFVKEGQTFTGDDSSTATLMLNLLGSFAQFERDLIRERQAEGIALAKAKGKYKGGQPKLTAEQAARMRERRDGGESIGALARAYEVSRQTVYRYLAAET
ncbi:MAG: recombinase family protein [Gordonia sp. (in: high G+C Gram-positive bacteria)]